MEEGTINMVLHLRLALIMIVLAYFALLFVLLRNRSLDLRYTLLWFFFGFVMIIGICFPRVLYIISNMIGIKVPSNALFMLGGLCTLLILMSLTSIVSKLNERNKRLIQEVAIIEKRVRDLDNSGEPK